MNTFSQYYKKSMNTRQDILKEVLKLQDADFHNLTLEAANAMIENAIGTYDIPYGIAPNFLINHKEYLIPMATEEPSVIAAAANAGKILAQNGGISAKVHGRLMIGQIAFANPKNIEVMSLYLKYNDELLHRLAQEAHPSIHKRGGGLVSFNGVFLKEENRTPFYVVNFKIDTKEAMGANIVNTILERIKPHLEKVFRQEALMSILTNYADQSLVSASVTIDPKTLNKGEDLGTKFQMASDFAYVDKYRATTHNKGIMNGISALVLATGNDTRAIEAAAHAYACKDGQYRPLSSWTYEGGLLKGTITLPMPLGSVGGSIGINPKAQLSQKIMRLENAEELMMVAASLGLAQNFAAILALITVGIQEGHMKLQAKSLLMAAGASHDTLEEAHKLLLQAEHMNLNEAEKIVKKLL